MRTREMAEALNLPKRKGGHFSRGEVVLALTMRAENKSADQIAVALGANRDAVGRLLARFTDTSAVALAKLRAAAGKAADNWIASQKPAAERGDHKPARDHLAAIGVIKENPVIGQQVVIIGSGQGAIGPDPWAPEPDPVPLKLPSASMTADDVIADLMDPNG